jgi:hypothetical protein
MLEIVGGRTRSHNVENSVWNRLRTCHKTNYTINELGSWKGSGTCLFWCATSEFLEGVEDSSERSSKMVFVKRFETVSCPAASEERISAPVSLKAGSLSKEQFTPLCFRMLCQFVLETAGMRVSPIKCLWSTCLRHRTVRKMQQPFGRAMHFIFVWWEISYTEED